MIPEKDAYISFLMGAESISDEELYSIGVSVIERFGSGKRGLLVPSLSVENYKKLLQAKMLCGYWNEIVGRGNAVFFFKMPDGTIEEMTLTDASERRIAELCSAFNHEPIERTANVLKYLTGNQFYSQTLAECYGISEHF